MKILGEKILSVKILPIHISLEIENQNRLAPPDLATGGLGFQRLCLNLIFPAWFIYKRGWLALCESRFASLRCGLLRLRRLNRFLSSFSPPLISFRCIVLHLEKKPLIMIKGLKVTRKHSGTLLFGHFRPTPFPTLLLASWKSRRPAGILVFK